MSGNYCKAFGKEFTGWKATMILYLFLFVLTGSGFVLGWQAAVDFHHIDITTRSKDASTIPGGGE